MWPYHEITREEFEKIKDHIEEIMIAHGAEVFEVDLPYEQGTTTIIIGKEPIEWTFPYDLTEQEMEDEVSYFLGEKPYSET